MAALLVNNATTPPYSEAGMNEKPKCVSAFVNFRAFLYTEQKTTELN